MPRNRVRSTMPVTPLVLALLTLMICSGLALAGSSWLLGSADAASGEGPVAAYSFDEENEETAEDVTLNEHDGAVEGPTWTDRGRFGGALSFNGEGEDCVTVPESKELELTEELTLEAWVKPSGPTEDDPIIFKEALGIGGVPSYAMGIGVTNAGKPEGMIGEEAVTETVEGPKGIESNVWTHLAFTYDGAHMRLYVNGALVSTEAQESAPPEAPGNLKIGCAAWWWNEGFNGKIDEVRLYDRALSEGEIQADRLAPLQTAPAGPTASYSFDEGEGSTVEDLTGNGHTGTIEGPEWTTRGRFGSALSFNGEGEDCVTVPESEELQLTEELTLEAWVKPSGETDEDPIIFKEAEGIGGKPGYAMGIGVTNEGKPEGIIGEEGDLEEVEGPKAIESNVWTHLAFTYDGAHMRLYINGTRVATQAQESAPPEAPGNLKIGCAAWYWEQGFNGKIDEVRIYDRALSEGEIHTDRAAPMQTLPGGPVAAYSFDEENEETAEDVTLNEHDGAVEGPTWTDRGRFGGALSFNGEGEDCVTVPESEELQLTEELTLEAWVKPNAPTNDDPIIFKEALGTGGMPGYAMGIGLTNAGKPEGIIGDEAETESVDAPSKIESNVWTHLAFTYDGAYMRLYVNGSLVATKAQPDGPLASTGSLKIGCSAYWEEGFDGRIDEVRLYHRALSEGEIQADRSAPLQTLPTGPVAAYSFDAGSGETAEDVTLNEHDGAVEGPTWTDRGRYGSALSFNGEGEDCVTVPESKDLELTEELTLEAWVKPSGETDEDPIIFKEAEGIGGVPSYAMGIGFTNEGKPEGVIGTEAVTEEVEGPKAIEANVWTHLAFTYDGAYMRLYVNGALVSTKKEETSPPEAPGNLKIGCSAWWWNQGFSGKIDEVRLYDRALSGGEIAADSSTPVQTPPRSPVAVYSFDEGSGETLKDITGNGHDGAIEGPTWSDRGKYGSALSFNGEGEDCVTVPESKDLELTEELTLEAWVKPSGPTEDDPIIFKEALGVGGVPSYAMGIGVTNAGKPEGIIGDEAETESVDAPSKIESNVWTHLAFTYDGAYMRLYVNGALVSTKKEERSPPEAPGNLKIGCSAWWWNQGFTGKIDEVRLYDRALSGGEIAASLGSSPLVETQEPEAGSTEAILLGTVNPMMKATTFRFEYGTTTAYGTSVPETIADTERWVTGSDPEEVDQAIEGLEPETTYHYRLVATNALGSFVGADQTFTTSEAEFSPFALFEGRVGVNWSGAVKSPTELTEVDESGAKMFRVVVYPGCPSNEKDVEGHRKYNDELFLDMAEKHITILPDVSGIPCRNDRKNVLPQIEKGKGAAKRWEEGLAILAKRYGPEGKFWELHSGLKEYAPVFWEIWNEENVEKNGSDEGKIVPERYGRLLGVSNEVLELDKKIKILLGGLLTTIGKAPPKVNENGELEPSENEMPLRTFLKRAKHTEDYDAVSLHPYAFKGSPKVIEGKVRNNIAQARGAVNKFGGGAETPIWVTELGWAIQNLELEKDEVHVAISEAEEEERLNLTFDMMKKESPHFNIKNLFWYNIKDVPGPEWAAHCGLFNIKGEARGFLAAFKAQAE
jgi:Concanavalin A-like lectin/glucanases superfamily